MKILVIAEHVGKTAPGIVFERIIKGLSQDHDLDLLVANYEPKENLTQVNELYKKENKKLHPRIFKFFIGLFSVNPLDKYWIKKNLKDIKGKYDLILSLVSFHHYLPLVAGTEFKKHFNAKLAVYCVDALPAPIGWPDNEFYRKGVYRMMRNYLPSCDALFSSNRKMLNYQLSTFVSCKKMITDVVFNPGNSELTIFPIDNLRKTFDFLYTGGVYGVRKVDYVFKAFERLLIDYPNSRLVFVGTTIEKDKMNLISSETAQKIKVFPFTSNLSSYYESATALIDIDADIENDIFLSSKITNYIMCNRIIISETGMNSPSKELFNNLKSIIQCSHNIDELFNAMVFAIKNYDSIDFEDRNAIINNFRLNQVIDKLNNNLKLL